MSAPSDQDSAAVVALVRAAGLRGFRPAETDAEKQEVSRLVAVLDRQHTGQDR